MALKIRINPEGWKKDLFAGLRASVANGKRLVATLAIGLSAFLITVFSANPEYSVQMLTSGVQAWKIAFVTRMSGMFAMSGDIAVVLTLLFALLVGVTMTNTVIQLMNNRISVDAIGALPGFLAGGCASCGVGVLSLLGFGGVLASMPFQGNLLRLGGVLLLLVLVIRTGNPDACKI